MTKLNFQIFFLENHVPILGVVCWTCLEALFLKTAQFLYNSILTSGIGWLLLPRMTFHAPGKDYHFHMSVLSDVKWAKVVAYVFVLSLVRAKSLSGNLIIVTFNSVKVIYQKLFYCFKDINLLTCSNVRSFRLIVPSRLLWSEIGNNW